VIYTSSKDRKI